MCLHDIRRSGGLLAVPDASTSLRPRAPDGEVDEELPQDLGDDDVVVHKQPPYRLYSAEVSHPRFVQPVDADPGRRGLA